MDMLGCILSIIGICVSIYYAKKVNHKKIKYLVAKKDKEYIFMFWNACNQAIFCEDLFAFSMYSGAQSKYKCLYSNEKDIPLKFVEGNDEVIKGKHRRKVDCVFDFLNKGKGYMVCISNEQKDDYLPVKFGVYGRIRGEDEKSVQYHLKIYSKLNANIKFQKDRVATVLFTVTWLIGALVGINIELIGLYQNGLAFDRVILIFIFVITIIRVCCFVYRNIIPLDLRKQYKKYKDKENFFEVRNSDELFYY